MTAGAHRTRLPLLLDQLLHLRVIEADETAGLLEQLGIATLADLQVALHDGRVRDVGRPGLDGRLRQAAPQIDADAHTVPLGRALDLLDSFSADVAAASPSIDLIAPTGDVRRFEPVVTALALVARAPDPPAAIDAICALPRVDEVRHRTERRVVVSVRQTEIDVRVAAPDEYGSFLFRTTGSPAHVHAIHRRGGLPRVAAREEDVYADAGLPFIPPELRHHTGEIEAAAAGTLPALIAREHIVGDLHTHTNYSDGADALESMVAEAARLGYQYVAITDHSERAAASRTVSRRDLARQREDIAALAERYPATTILQGIEVDIMRDGSLDFPDRILEPLDIVIASLHDRAGHDGKTLTRRCLEAIRHPLVSVVTHPANRVMGKRDGYPLDFDAIYDAAAQTGTALEIDGAPSHLDLDGEHARAAIAAGVTLVVDSDCHRARLLDRQMHLGIGTARRGWVEPRHVLNTRPLAEVRAFIAAKRASR